MTQILLQLGKALLLIGQSIARRWMRHQFLRGTFLVTFSLSLTILSIGAFSEAFMSSSLGPLTVPIEHAGREVRDTVALSDLARPVGNGTTKTYIFVIDCSGSVDETLKVPPWYKSAVETLEESSYIRAGAINREEPRAYDVSRVTLYMLLRDLYESPENEGGESERPKFAVWNVCGHGEIQYPEVGVVQTTTRANIDTAIETVQAQRLHPEWPKTTDFAKLFNNILKTYRLERRDAGNSYILTIISDFLDDDGTTARGGGGSETRWQEIEYAIRRLSGAKISANLVIVSEEQGHELRLVGLMRDNMAWYRFHRRSLGQLISAHSPLMFSVNIVPKPIRLFYDDDWTVDSVSTIEVDKDALVRLAVLPRGTRSDSEWSFKVVDSSLSFSSPESDEWEPHISGGPPLYISVLRGNTILFRHEGSRPSPGENILEVALESDRQIYLVPIRFVRRLPQLVALSLSCLYAAFALSALSCFIAIFVLGVSDGLATSRRAFRASS